MARSLAEIRSMSKDQLKQISKQDLLASVIADQNVNANTNDDIMKKIKKQLQDLQQNIAIMRQEALTRDKANEEKMNSMQRTINKQSEILGKQQMYLEGIDRKKREKNIVILGVPEDNIDLEESKGDEAKINNIWGKIGESCTRISHKRLGKLDENKIREGKVRPILIVVDSKEAKEAVLEKSKILKDKGELFRKIYIKKDIHPEVRKEWDRLRAAEVREKNDPANQGAIIRLDTKERKLYRNDSVIDSWTPHPF